MQLTSSTWWEPWAQNSSRMCPRILFTALEGDPKIRGFVSWPNYYYFVLLECFPLSLHFLTSLMKFVPRNYEGLGGGNNFSAEKKQVEGTPWHIPGRLHSPVQFQGDWAFFSHLPAGFLSHFLLMEVELQEYTLTHVSSFQVSACTYLVPRLGQATLPSQGQTEEALQSAVVKDSRDLKPLALCSSSTTGGFLSPSIFTVPSL